MVPGGPQQRNAANQLEGELILGLGNVESQMEQFLGLSFEVLRAKSKVGDGELAEFAFCLPPFCC